MVLCHGLSSCNAQAAVLVTGSEDGTVRVWSTAHLAAALRTPCSPIPSPLRIICPSKGVIIPAMPASQLECARSAAPVCAVRLQGGGGWVVCAVGGATPVLVVWSLEASAPAVRVSLPCCPQAVALVPGEVLLVGTTPVLYR